MEIVVLGTKNYADQSKNYGDCILINTDRNVFIYDCGSKEHAQLAMQHMDQWGCSKAIFILSHNDSDHFNGLPYLLENNKISLIYTTLLLKHVDNILVRIDDGRKTRDSVKKQILDAYDNIAKLSGCPIKDIYLDSLFTDPSVEILGPKLDYMLDTVAKRLDGREGNTQDGETAVNATSIQVKVKISQEKTFLLCGDSAYTPLESLLQKNDFKYIQLPHHGKSKQAEKIFEATNPTSTIYIVSDNTGDSNGGSNKLNIVGHNVKNTKKEGTLSFKSTDFTPSYKLAVAGPSCLGI